MRNLWLEQILSAVKANDVTAGLLAVIHTPPKEAVKLVPGEGTTAIHVAAQRDDVFWTQMLLWVSASQQGRSALGPMAWFFSVICH